jgi:hypothetical protein
MADIGGEFGAHPLSPHPRPATQVWVPRWKRGESPTTTLPLSPPRERGLGGEGTFIGSLTGGSQGGCLTTFRTIQQGEQAGHGVAGAYYRLTHGPGEPHVRRLDLAPDDAAPTRRESLLHFVYFTDLHILDPESPGRYEFVERLHGSKALHLLLPAYRPQEFLQLHAVDAMIRTMNSIADSPVTGAPVQLLLATGDQTDNAQLNELQWVIRLMEGGTVALREPVMEGEALGGLTYEGVASDGWGDPSYWHPSEYADDYKLRFGFPAYPGLLDEACRPFQAQGIKLPWLACHGNHDSLVLGTAGSNPAYERIVTGSEKARSLPPGFDPLQHVELFISHPETFLAGPTTTVRADSTRRSYSPHQFVQAFAQAGGEPRGHGFTPQTPKQAGYPAGGARLGAALGVAPPGYPSEGTAYYVDDRYPRVRIIVLDTVNMCGNYQGSIGAAQFAWLERRLAEVHSRYWDDTRRVPGSLVESGNEDRLVVVCSHHGLATLINDLAVPGQHHEVVTDLPRMLAPEIESLLHRFPNVILWVNGHTHRNAVRPRLDPQGRHPCRPGTPRAEPAWVPVWVWHPRGTRGFWEVTTSSLIDWPCQARMVEIVSNGDGTLSVFCTMVDHAAPPDPQSADGLLRLASIHRELAANDPHAGIASGRQGELSDRNVELVMAVPFPLE